MSAPSRAQLRAVAPLVRLHGRDPFAPGVASNNRRPPTTAVSRCNRDRAEEPGSPVVAQASLGGPFRNEGLDDPVTAGPLAASATTEQLLIRGCLLLCADMYAAAVLPLRRALKELLERPDSRLLGLGCQAAIELYDEEA